MEDALKKLYRDTYSTAKQNINNVSYVETNGTGVPKADALECAAMADVFCSNASRKSPLLIGSSKSNLGHTNAAAGKWVTAVVQDIIHGLHGSAFSVTYECWTYFISPLRVERNLQPKATRRIF